MNDRMTERNAAIKDRWMNRMGNEFYPGYTPEHTPDAANRLANAAEYAAFQLGQMHPIESPYVQKVCGILADKKFYREEARNRIYGMIWRPQ
jgi:hypothetical protein